MSLASAAAAGRQTKPASWTMVSEAMKPMSHSGSISLEKQTWRGLLGLLAHMAFSLESLSTAEEDRGEHCSMAESLILLWSPQSPHWSPAAKTALFITSRVLPL